MKLSLAQTKSLPGDSNANLQHHLLFIDRAIALGADAIIFPELSLTGYEPTLAESLATTAADLRLQPLQEKSNAHRLTIGIGLPLGQENGTTISLLFFQPSAPRSVYAKQFLHADEEPYFIAGEKRTAFLPGTKTALAICYELSVPAHAEAALASGADAYLASVAKTADGVVKGSERLAAIAKQYAISTLMVNCVGKCDGVVCAGGTAAWNKEGLLIGRLGAAEEGILVVNTTTGLVTAEVV